MFNVKNKTYALDSIAQWIKHSNLAEYLSITKLKLQATHLPQGGLANAASLILCVSVFAKLFLFLSSKQTQSTNDTLIDAAGRKYNVFVPEAHYMIDWLMVGKWRVKNQPLNIIKKLIWVQISIFVWSSIIILLEDAFVL